MDFKKLDDHVFIWIDDEPVPLSTFISGTYAEDCERVMVEVDDDIVFDTNEVEK